MSKRHCRQTKCSQKLDNGNCCIQGKDNLPVQCVGAWAEDKYFFLETYLNATRKTREKFSDQGNAVFIDLFAGPGISIVKHNKREIKSGGVRAIEREEAAFNESILIDRCESNTNALSKRLEKYRNVHIKCGDSNQLVDALVAHLKRKSYRYHFAYIDPFGPDGLKFDTIRKLASLQRMDMLIHFPIGPINRNLPVWLKKDQTILDDFLGTTAWREKITVKDGNNKNITILLDIFKEQLLAIGYPKDGLSFLGAKNDFFTSLPVVSIQNTRAVDLYLLILAAKHKIAQKIWTSVIKKNRQGQKQLF